MTFELADYWVWDFWIADDGDRFHLYYLHAPKSLGNPDLRHRNARIGHASSIDLISWDNHGQIFDTGAPGSFDDTATWTGSVVRGDDGLWRMFYTGARFLSADQPANVETIGLAVSSDLHSWEKRPGPVCEADGRWYEKLGDVSGWPEEAWRDPWVFRVPGSSQWHMLVTTRANKGDAFDRGVIGYAVSNDLDTWDVRAPLSAPGAAFGHLEVPQIVHAGGRTYLLFCCTGDKLAGSRAGETGGIYCADISDGSPYPVDRAVRLTDQRYYAGRIVTGRDGETYLMAFEDQDSTGNFVGRIADPMAIDLNAGR